jgi:CRP-like cAMP-binding protein
LGAMAHDALVDPLQRVALFQGLKPEQIAEIGRQAERIVFRPGDRIIEEGGEGDAAFLIVAGDAMRTSGPEIQGAAERISPGSLIGEMAMLIDTEHTSTIIAEGPVRALKITRASLHGQMAADPSLADHFVTKIIGRLHALAEELRNIDRELAFESGVHAPRYSSHLSLDFVRPGVEQHH